MILSFPSTRSGASPGTIHLSGTAPGAKASPRLNGIRMDHPEVMERISAAAAECQLLLRHRVVRAVGLQVYDAGSLIAEATNVVLARPHRGFRCEAAGPPVRLEDLLAEPRQELPPTAAWRCFGLPDPACPAGDRARWFSELGWSDAPPLRRPAGGECFVTGRSELGGLWVEHRLLLDPRYDPRY